MIIKKKKKDPKLPPLAILDPQGEQEVKAKSPSPSTEGEPICKKWKSFIFFSFFSFLFFSPGLQGNPSQNIS